MGEAASGPGYLSPPEDITSKDISGSDILSQTLCGLETGLLVNDIF